MHGNCALCRCTWNGMPAAEKSGLGPLPLGTSVKRSPVQPASVSKSSPPSMTRDMRSAL